MKNVVLRSFSGIIYMAVIVGAIIAGSWWFLFLIALFAVTAVVEFRRMEHQNSLAAAILDVLGAITIVSTIYACCVLREMNMQETMIMLFGPYAVYMTARTIAELYLRNPNPFESLAVSAATQLYIVLPLALMSVLYFVLGSKWLVLCVFIMIWINDTGAYVVGSMLGRHHLFPRISPKKTWEGFAGGMAFTIGAAAVMQSCFDGLLGNISLIEALILGAVISAASTFGDLAESQLKRTAGIKDSGHIIPGHGGILDRIDSLLLVVPVTVLFYILIA